MKKTFFFLLFILATLSLNANGSLSASIKFADEEIYFIGRPIIIKFEVYNYSSSNYFIEIADDVSFNFDFKIFSDKGETIDYSKDYIIAKKNREKIFTKSILLAPGQSFAVEINISQWFDFKESGEFFIQGIFYPSVDKNLSIEKTREDEPIFASVIKVN